MVVCTQKNVKGFRALEHNIQRACLDMLLIDLSIVQCENHVRRPPNALNYIRSSKTPLHTGANFTTILRQNQKHNKNHTSAHHCLRETHVCSPQKQTHNMSSMWWLVRRKCGKSLHAQMMSMLVSENIPSCRLECLP